MQVQAISRQLASLYTRSLVQQRTDLSSRSRRLMSNVILHDKAAPHPNALAWIGNKEHHAPDGKSFRNPWPSIGTGEHTLQDVSRMIRESTPERSKGVSLPSTSPDWTRIHRVARGDKFNIEATNEILVTWIGHASFLLQIGGISILTDPVFSERCSPFQWAGPRRYMPVLPDEKASLSMLIDRLPPIDVVLISHNHYDHLDLNTVRALERKFQPLWFVPLGVADWMRSTCQSTKVSEHDWWDMAHFGSSSSTGDKSKQVRVVCTPAQHFTARGLFDRNKSLWASWAVDCRSIGGPVLWFGGDTGYRDVPSDWDGQCSLPVCPTFGQIGQLFGGLIDLSLIPIGAYFPSWFMSRIHTNPEDAVDVHLDVKSRVSIGMHWGTFKLTQEPIDEPPKRLSQELLRRGISSDVFRVLMHGETVAIPFEKRRENSEQENGSTE